MAEAAWKSGTTLLVATPHMQPSGYPYHPAQADLSAKLRELQLALKDRGIPLRVLLGAEVLFSVDIVRRLHEGRALSMAGGPYVLVELAGRDIPYGFQDRLYELQLEGYVPILAHPERHAAFQHDPRLVLPLVERGMLVQITAGSLLGRFGKASMMAAETMVTQGIVHVVASDGHSAEQRPPVLAQARARLEELVGAEAARWMVSEAPERIVEGKPVPTGSPAESRLETRASRLARSLRRLRFGARARRRAGG